jgi:hypothetical protein
MRECARSVHSQGNAIEIAEAGALRQQLQVLGY